jgi:hypothetical protein
MNLTFSSNGNIHAKIHENLQDVSGVGETTGAKYQITQTIDEEMNLVAAQEATLTVDVRVIGQGSVPNFLEHVTEHITVNANGDVTATVANLTAECQG